MLNRVEYFAFFRILIRFWQFPPSIISGGCDFRVSFLPDRSESPRVISYDCDLRVWSVSISGGTKAIRRRRAISPFAFKLSVV
jgi:hypothetical protein